MPFKIETTSTIDRDGATIYVVAITIDGVREVPREFRSKEDAECFARSEQSRLLGK
jgi:hypothetical protein